MKKEFNITGLCNPNLHYMADITGKIDEVYNLVEKGKYFTINKPHQYGKTTIQAFLANRINLEEDSIALDISFESIDYEIYQSKPGFINAFLRRLAQTFEFYAYPELSAFVSQNMDKIDSLDLLSTFIGKLIQQATKKIILIIDEVDRSSNNQLFLDFLAILRDRYLSRNKNLTFPTFHSVILSGVYDVKKIKFKIEPQATQKYNSPWNIAMDFNVDLSLDEAEIASMLEGYAIDKKIKLDIAPLARRLLYYTCGHPFLTSYLCKIIDEELIEQRIDKTWQVVDVDEAFKKILTRENTNFDSLIKNIENNPDLYSAVFNISIIGETLTFNKNNPVIDLGNTIGVFGKRGKATIINNKIYQHLIYDYMISKVETSTSLPTYEGKYIKNGILDLKNLLLGFQSFMKENYSQKDSKFLEKHGRLLFMAFVKPIINGKGFDFKEVQISEERRLDVVLTYLDQKYVVELKIWRGPEAHNEGLDQLSDYLDRQNLKAGYLLIYDFRLKEKEYKQAEIKHKDKDVFAVWV